MAMSPSPGAARRRSISSARPSVARRAPPSAAVKVVENTTFGSARQAAAHSRVSSSGSPGTVSAVSQKRIISYSFRPIT
jgi:hypothetical protein